MVLNGINYTEKHLTDEEMAVVEAMRMGAKVQVNFFFSTKEACDEHAKKINMETFPKGGPTDLGYNLTAYRFESERVYIVHFVQN